jgi:hypothetical protein
MWAYTPKPGADKFCFVVCPLCKKILYVKKIFWTPRFDHVKIWCNHCSADFAKEESPQVVGL